MPRVSRVAFLTYVTDIKDNSLIKGIIWPTNKGRYQFYIQVIAKKAAIEDHFEISKHINPESVTIMPKKVSKK